MRSRFAWVLACVLASLPVTARAQAGNRTPDLDAMDIEALGRITVTSASRGPEPVSHASTAIFVITREDMRRAGATSIPDALRLAPGLQVARVTARDWSVTARGFAEASPNKLLVLVDGRPVYSPLFAGVFWDVQAWPIADVDRIEVILGPGATLWGSNAVNGVINIITRSAAVTRGGRVSARTSTDAPIAAQARYGFGLGAASALRIYGMYSSREASKFPDGTEADDDWERGQGGFRFDSELGASDHLTIQGDAYAGAGDQVARRVMVEPPYAEFVPGRREVSGGNVLARWTRTLNQRSELRVQAYYDRAVRTQLPATGRVAVDIADLEFQHRFAVGQRQNLVWGAGYRRISDELEDLFAIGLVPPARSTYLLTAFAQDEIELVPSRFFATLGAKLERNDFTGLEFQPSARLRWSPSAGHTAWSSVSRAVRIPTRLDTDIRFIANVLPTSPLTLVRIDGNEEFDSESAVAAEAGYRGELSSRFSVDVSAYHSWYAQLRSTHPLPPVTEGEFTVQPVTLGNDASGRTWGGTAAVNWRPATRVLVRASYTRLEMRVTPDADAPPGSQPAINAGANPEQFGSLATYIDLPANLELHLIGRYVGELTAPVVAEYVEAGARLGWRVTPDLSIALRGENLLHDRHAEFPAAPQREMPRRGELHVEWRF
ncbi:MAG TPA: TonB-dependent receptor [Gemmatimonadales bacterium]|nr:TonB-dependent receptor [Gemmatimonadales bacterium]